jgi:hypothetical protein
MKGFINRLGIFFLIVGVAVLALFFTSDFVQAPNIGYLFWGIVFAFLGYFFLRVTRKEPKESQRFRLFRRIFFRKKKEE